MALFWYVCILRLAISTHVYFAKNVAHFPFNSWFSFQRCVVFYGDYIIFYQQILTFYWQIAISEDISIIPHADNSLQKFFSSISAHQYSAGLAQIYFLCMYVCMYECVNCVCVIKPSWLTSPAGWLPRTGISSGTLCSVIEYGLPLPFLPFTQALDCAKVSKPIVCM